MPRETLADLRTEQIWDVLGIRLNGPKAEGKTIVLNWQFTDTNQTYVLTLENCALTYLSGATSADADAAFVLTRGNESSPSVTYLRSHDAASSPNGTMRCFRPLPKHVR